MKKPILIACLSASLLTMAQPKMIESTVSAGKNLQTGKEVAATKYEFQQLIFQNKLDSASHTLTLQLRGTRANGKRYLKTGYLTVFDLQTKSLAWSRQIDYSQSKTDQNNNLLFLNTGVSSVTRLNLIDGKELWNSEHVLFATLPKLNIGLGYQYIKNTDALSNKLEGIDMTSGQTIWRRTVDKRFGWNGVVVLNDTTIMIKSSGLHLINPATGEGWDYSAKTGIEAYSKTRLDNSASLSRELLIGEEIEASGYDLLSDLVSNVAEDNSNYLFASKEELVRIANDGKIRWKTSLPTKETSHSKVFADDKWVYVINDGEAKYGEKRIAYGKPYIASFDKNTGTRKYFNWLNTKGYPLVDYSVKADTATLVFKDRIIIVTLNNGEISKTIPYPTSEMGLLEYSVNRHKTFVKTDSGFRSLYQCDPTGSYLTTSNKTIVKLNSQLQYEKKFNKKEIFLMCGETAKYNLLYNNKKITVTDKDGKQIGELNISHEAFVHNDKLYEIGDNYISEIDLNTEFN